MIEAIIFDLDDTLYNYSSLHDEALKEMEKYICIRYMVTAERFYAAFFAARRETKEILGNTAASHNRMLYCQKTLEHLSISPADGALEMYEIYWTYILERMTLNKGAERLLEISRNRGIKIGICSDLTVHIQHRKLRALGISSYVDALVTSEEAGAEKPDPRIFTMILKKLQCRPEKALFVGDDFFRDIQGAEQLGIRSLWLGGTYGDNTIASLEEAEALIV